MARCIVVFDSGVGALSLLADLRRRVPGTPLVYASDNAAHPYGTCSADELTNRVERVLTALDNRFTPALTIVGCNTASTVALPRLRNRLTHPIVGVVPAIKPAARLSRSRCIALLGTPGTIARPYTDRLIAEFAADCEVLRLGSSELVAMAEDKLRGHDAEPHRIRELLAPLRHDPRSARVDTIVLGCTHFPLLRAELAQAFGRPVHWVDSADAIARRAASLLARPMGPRLRDGTDIAVFTGPGAEVDSLRPTLLHHGFTSLEIISP